MRVLLSIAAIVLFFSGGSIVPSWGAQQLRLLSTWYDCPFNAECVASRQFRKGTVLLLFNPQTGRSARAVVWDYGPKAWTGRSLDVSRQIAAQLGMLSTGVVWLGVAVIGHRDL